MQCICTLAADVLVIREDDAVVGAVRKISHNKVWCSGLVLGVNVQVTLEEFRKYLTRYTPNAMY